MKIGIIIPTRGDRSEFLRNCLRMVKVQTWLALQGNTANIVLIDEQPDGEKKDITKRYRKGYDLLRNTGVDLIALMEDDDWYHPDYLSTVIGAWHFHGKPDLFGLGYTVYYHLKLKKWLVMEHPGRACAMNTLIKPDLKFNWPADEDPYTDIHLWLHSGLHGITFNPVPLKEILEGNPAANLINMGMKHGVGLCGGKNHTDWLERYRFSDPQGEFLQQHLDAESFKFYFRYFNYIRPSK